MRTIVNRELRDHLQSLQFIVLLLVGIVLFSANGIIFSKKYLQAEAAFQQSTARSQPQPDTRMVYLFRRPNLRLFLAEGGDLDRPAAYFLFAKGYFNASAPRPRDYKLPDLPKIDWAFIIKTIFSLYVVLLGYAAVSGEREDGTLRLVFSNSIGRTGFLMGKYFAILSATLVPLAVGCILSTALLAILLPQVLTFDTVAQILFLLLLSIVYLSLFAFLSLLVSSLIRRSSLALLVLLAMWVLFAVLIPDTSGVLAQRLAKVPSDYQTAKNLGPLVQKEVWDKIKGIQTRIDKGELRTEEAVKAEADKAFEEGQEKMRFYEKSYEDSVAERARLARSLSRLSPMALFQYAADDIAASGIHGEEEFLKNIRSYSKLYDAYVLKKTGKLVSQSNWMFSSAVKLDGKAIDLHSPQPEAYRGDMSDFPKFIERPFRLSEGIRSALGDIAGLLVWNILLAGLAFSAFLRTDVR